MSKSSELENRIERSGLVLILWHGPQMQAQIIEMVEKEDSTPTNVRKQMEKLIAEWQKQLKIVFDLKAKEVLVGSAVALAQIKRDTPEDYEELIQMYIQD